jgi:predicted AlkP superfamily phosphohydrolase/phosphomutase
MTVYDGSDRVQHFFWKYHDKSHPRYEFDSSLSEAIKDYYTTVDRGIGQLLDYAGNDCDVIILSDHGFGPLTHDIYIEEWLSENGFLTHESKMSTEQITTNTLGSLMWTVWRGIKKANLDTLAKTVLPASLFDTGREIKREMKDHHANIVWDETEVFFTTLSGQSLYVNLDTRFSHGTVSGDEYRDVLESVQESLQSLTRPDTDEPLIEEVWTKEQIFEGWAIEEAPDLVVQTNPIYTLKGGRSRTLLQPSAQKGLGRSGDHRSDGMFIATGPSFGQGQVQQASVIDIAPTLLYLHECPIPEYIDGSVLRDTLSESTTEMKEVKHTQEYGEVDRESHNWNSEEESELQEQLENLGYLG